MQVPKFFVKSIRLKYKPSIHFSLQEVERVLPAAVVELGAALARGRGRDRVTRWICPASWATVGLPASPRPSGSPGLLQQISMR